MGKLEYARKDVETLKRYGIRPSDYHCHVGENGVRCEFCGEPSFFKIHDPLRLGRGRDDEAAAREHTQEAK